MGIDISHQFAVDDLQARAGETAREKGFWRQWDDTLWLEQLVNSYLDLLITEADAKRLKRIASDYRNAIVAQKLMLTVSELGEALESLRDTGVDGIHDEGNFGEELADVHIRLFDLAEILNLEIGHEIVRKMAHNRERPAMHGRKM